MFTTFFTLEHRLQYISHCSIVSRVSTPDSYIHKGYLQQQGTDTAALMQSLLQTAPWKKRDNQAMKMRGHHLKRTKFFAFAHDDPNLFLKYGYTSFQWASLKLYKR